jgi:hypothetical protein
MLWKLFERFKPESSGRVLLYLKGKETKILCLCLKKHYITKSLAGFM